MAIVLRNLDLVVSRKANHERIHLLDAYAFKNFISKMGQEQIVHVGMI